jgi:hypothetical protein
MIFLGGNVCIKKAKKPKGNTNWDYKDRCNVVQAERNKNKTASKIACIYTQQ